MQGTYDFFENTSKYGMANGLGAMERMYAVCRRDDGYARSQEEQNQRFSGMSQPLAYQYQWKIREALDPKRLGDAYYMTLEPKE